MSLDVTLTVDEFVTRSGTGVFIREDGRQRELTATEVAERWPGQTVAIGEQQTRDVFDYNITHNLTKMAGEVGLYEPLWRPDEHGMTTAADLIEPLAKGYRRLIEERERLQAFNPSNGWGSYDGLVEFVSKYLCACIAYPHATVSVSR